MQIKTIQALSSREFLSRRFETIVFSGGGNRCWWQAGLVEVLSQHACWNAKRLIGASAGAGIATAFATGRIANSLAVGMARFNATPSNIEWRELLKGKRPFVLPKIYPEWIGSFLDAADLVKLKLNRLKVDVVITRPIPFLPLTLSTVLALVLYSSEKYWLKNFHARLPHYVGLRAEHLDLTRSDNLEDARALLMASAAAVPITPVHQVNGRAALDGGFYDSVPLPADRADDGGALLLLTRHRPDLPQIFTLQNRVYLQPQRKVAAVNLDCTSGEKIRLTYEQGRDEALRLTG